MRLADRLNAMKQAWHEFLPIVILGPLQPSPTQFLEAPGWVAPSFIRCSPASGRAVDGLLNLTGKAVVTQFGRDRCSQPRSPALPLFAGDFQ